MSFRPHLIRTIPPLTFCAAAFAISILGGALEVSLILDAIAAGWVVGQMIGYMSGLDAGNQMKEEILAKRFGKDWFTQLVAVKLGRAAREAAPRKGEI